MILVAASSGRVWEEVEPKARVERRVKARERLMMTVKVVRWRWETPGGVERVVRREGGAVVVVEEVKGRLMLRRGLVVREEVVVVVEMRRRQGGLDVGSRASGLGLAVPRGGVLGALALLLALASSRARAC